MYIYLITNSSNNKVYVGQTTYKNPNNRWSAHKTELKANRCNNPYLQRAWNKHGSDVWEYAVIDEAKTIDELNSLESHYINKIYDSTNPEKGYNIRGGGDNFFHSEETKRKISEARKKLFSSKKGDKVRKILSQKASQQKRTMEDNIKRSKTLRKYDWNNPEIISPDGKRYIVYTVKGFCREHGIKHDGNFRRMIRGTYKQSKGWTLAIENNREHNRCQM